MSLRLSADGRNIIFKMDRPRAERQRLEKEGNREGYLQQYLPLYVAGRGAWIQSCTDGDPGRFALGNPKFACTLTTWVLDLDSDRTRRASDADVKALAPANETFKEQNRIGAAMEGPSRMMITPAPDGRRSVWFENVDPEHNKGFTPSMSMVASIDGKQIRCEFKECAPRPTTVFDRLWWSGDEIVFEVADGPGRTLTSFYAWNPRKAALRTILRTDDRFSSCERAGSSLVCGHETWTSPRNLVSLDFKTGAITPIADVNPTFRDISFTRVEKIVGTDDKGRTVHAHLVYPKDYRPGQRYPLIVTTYHSYGFLRGATGDEQPIPAYAASGIAVLSFDESSRADSNNLPYAEMVAAHFKNLYVDQQPARAIEKMVDQLVERGLADPDRIGITGFSYGDQILGTALLRRNYAAASSAGVGDVPTDTKLPVGYNSEDANIKVFGSPLTEEGRRNRAQYSTGANAARIETPILMNVSDTEFAWQESTFNAFQWAGKPVELYQYPNERHVKFQPIHKYWVFSRNMDWFRFWLLGQEDPDPAKADQYKRWREFRRMHEANLQKAGK